MELTIDRSDRELLGFPGRYSSIAEASASAARGVAGTALASPATIDGEFSGLDPSELTDSFARDIFAAAQKLHAERQRVDLRDVYHELVRTGRWDKGTLAAEIYELYERAAVGTNATYYVNCVRRMNSLRGLALASTEIAARLESMQSEDFDPNDLAADVFMMIDEAVTDRSVSEPVLIEKAVAEAVATVGEKINGVLDERIVPTGFQALADYLPAFRPGQFIVIGARPSVGKTALGISFAMTCSHIWKRPCYFASLEMTYEEIGHRVALAITDASGNRIRTGHADQGDYQKIGRANTIIKGSPLYVDDTTAMRVEQIMRACRRIKRKHGLALVVVDYLQLVQASNQRQQRREQVEEVSRSLKRVARELEVPVIAMAQLNREVDARGEAKPKLSDLREAGGIEQDADIVGLLYRMPENHDDDKIWKIGLSIAKHRNGPTGDVVLDFHRSAMRFQDPVPTV